jgi:hypothetical protein
MEAAGSRRRSLLSPLNELFAPQSVEQAVCRYYREEPASAQVCTYMPTLPHFWADKCFQDDYAARRVKEVVKASHP